MGNKTMESKTMTIEEFLKEQEDIHDIQAKVMEWVATDDLYKTIQKRKHENEEKKLALEVDLLNAIVRALQSRNTEHGKRMRGVAQGLLRAAEIYELFDKNEMQTLNRILELAK